MVNRFAKTKRDYSLLRQLVLPVLLFLLLFALFAGGLSSVSAAAEREQLRAAQQAVARAAVNCYAVEGFYPPTLDYLVEHYGLAVDLEKYAVDYQCFATNIMPDITVVTRGARLVE